MVVLMREGTRTVLSMQNNYEGPPEQFALVIPVPSVLHKDQVKTLPHDVFARVDALGSPRLVEYWETDPCSAVAGRGGSGGSSAGKSASAGGGGGAGQHVTVEASFAVGEYDIVILSTDDSSSLETWLLDNRYHIPEGAADYLMPYVSQGMKFFVAKVDPSRIELRAGQTALSPLRFHYDSTDFMLPIRLGLLNSRGQQDLIINILAPERYEVANHENVTIPTNIRVQNEVRNDLGGFYEALFARLLEKHPGAVVTEYAWSASSCDPCPPGSPLSLQDSVTLGLDVMQPSLVQSGEDAGVSPIKSFPKSSNYTLTRLHYRYTRESLGEDLVFRRAEEIVGGRGVPDNQGQLSTELQFGAGTNNFQGRYVILHPWEKTLTCDNPVRGRWGGPLGSGSSKPMLQTAKNTAVAGDPPRAGVLPALLAQSLTALDVVADKPLDPLPPLSQQTAKDAGSVGAEPPAAEPAADSCECSLARRGHTARSPALHWFLVAGLGLVFGYRRRFAQRARPTKHP
jgi:hypothetical protein